MSIINRQFSLALEALAELKADDTAPPSSVEPMPAAPSLSEVLAGIEPLPREALLLGVASDGLPVLLNLRDPLLCRSLLSERQAQAKQPSCRQWHNQSSRPMIQTMSNMES